MVQRRTRPHQIKDTNFTIKEKIGTSLHIEVKKNTNIPESDVSRNLRVECGVVYFFYRNFPNNLEVA